MAMFRGGTTIKQRLIFMIVLISAVSVLLTTLTISVIGVYGIRQRMVDDTRITAKMVGERNQAYLLLTQDEEKVRENMERSFSEKPSVLTSCIYTLDGVLFAAYHHPSYPRHDCPTDRSERVEMEDGELQIMQRFYKDGGPVGTIYIRTDQREIEDYIGNQVMIAVGVALGVLFTAYLMAVRLQRSISQPVLRLADTAREISVRKDYSVRAAPFGDRPPKYDDELKILTDAFNGMLTEIGERERQLKRQNKELEKARDAAESANRAKSQFLANISHELRTPLNAIIGFSSILMNQLFGPMGSEKYQEYAKDINESGSHLLDIINDILDISKAEAGKLDLTLEEVHVGKAVNKCITILSERAEKGKIAITTDIPKPLPPLIADRLRFIQILLNILSNAVKFTEEGGSVHITVRTGALEGSITHFIISIADTGIGMDENDIGKAFQSFGQVDSGLNRKYEGTGLGLPLTRRLVELHHGTIEIKSALGQGTTVIMTFPAVPPAGDWQTG